MYSRESLECVWSGYRIVGLKSRVHTACPLNPQCPPGDFTLQHTLATRPGVDERTPAGGMHRGTARLFSKMPWGACPTPSLPASAPRSPMGSRRENGVSCLLIRPGKPHWVKVAAVMEWGGEKEVR